MTSTEPANAARDHDQHRHLPGRDLPAGPEAAEPGPGRRRGARRLLSPEMLTATATPAGFLVILLAIFGPWLGGTFLDTGNRVFDIYQNVPPLLLAMGVVVALSAGQFDLSAGSMATLAVFITVGLTTQHGVPLAAVIPLALAIGVVGGLLNGLLVVGLRINAFIATLGTGAVFTGVSELYSGGQTISFSTSPAVTRAVSWFAGPRGFGSFHAKPPLALSWLVIAALLWCGCAAARLHWQRVKRPGLRDGLLVAAVVVAAALLLLAGIPAQLNWSILLLAAAAAAVWLVLRQTSFGRSVYATGGNLVAAQLAGVATGRLRVIAFVISGVFAAVAGIVLSADQGTAVPQIADGFLLPAYAAAFLSTVILSSGRFHVWGTLAGGLAVVWVAQGLVIGGLPFTWTDLINGAVLIIAVSLSTTLRRMLVAR
jgi:ribose/xylose/arabinose/galactoside ABC-type transport system permease subunit